MKLRTVLFVAFSLLLLVGGVAIWIGSPRVVVVTPPPGSQDLPADIPFQITFSQPIQPESLKDQLQIKPDIQGYLSWTDQVLTFIPKQPWPGGQTITVTLRSGVRAANGLGLPVWQSTSWSFEIKQKLLAYLWPASDLADLYTLDPDSGEITRLTEGAVVHDYAVSPDGNAIYYTFDRLRGGGEIVRLPIDGGGSDAARAIETVAVCENAVCRNPTASSNGRWLAYEQVPETGGRTQIGVWLLDLLSGQSTPVGVSGHPGRYPTWSRTGWLAIYDLIDQAYRIIHPESGSTVLLLNGIGEPGSWGPEGNLFLASEFFEESTDLVPSGTSGHMKLYSLEQSSAVQDLTQAYYLDDTGGVISPDGQQIAFTRKYLDQARWTPGRQLWVMTLPETQTGSTNAYPITDAPDYNHYGIAWSPDGQQIAFMRFNQVAITELPELWLIDVDGSNPTQLIIGGFAPKWIP